MFITVAATNIKLGLGMIQLRSQVLDHKINLKKLKKKYLRF